MDEDEIRAAVERHVKLHRRLYGRLIDNVRNDRYLSYTQMAMIEEGAWPDEMATYLDALMDKVEEDRFPSVPMMKKLQGLIGCGRPAASRPRQRAMAQGSRPQRRRPS